MDRAAKRVKATGKEIDSTAAALGRFAAAAGAAGLAFASMAAGMAMHSARSMDATAKMAEQIGTTTEALTGLRFAAQQFADVSDKTFDMALRRMTRRIEEAAAGSGGAKNALDALGLSAKQLAQMSPDQQFLVLADAMKNTESQAQRLRHTMAIFDTEGMPLVAALQRGSEEMERQIEIARRFGLVLSTEAAQAASDFTDNIKALTDASSGIKQQVAEAVLPSLVAITDRLVEISKSVGPVGEKVETALKVAGVAAGGLAVILTGRLTAAVVGSAGSFALATVEAGRYQMALARMAGVSAAAATGIGAMTAATRAASGLMTILGGSVGLAATLGLTAAAFLAMGRDAKAASVDIDDLSESFKTLSAQKLELRLFDLEDEVQRLEDQARQSGEILRTMEADALALADAQGVTAEELENLRRSLLEQRDAHATNNAELDRARTLLNQVIDHLERMRGAAHGAAGGVNALNQAMHSEAGEKYLAQIPPRVRLVVASVFE